MSERHCFARGNSFEVQGNWLVPRALELQLTVLDTELLGSRSHFLRFDLYPLYAASHQNRHHGFWDLPFKYVTDRVTNLVLRGSKLRVKRTFRTIRLKAGWRGSLEFRGYCILHVSVWQRAHPVPVLRESASSRHVLLPEQGDMPLIQASIPVTQRCNLSCPMCMRHTARDFQEVDIPRDVLNALLEASPCLHAVSVMGVGEPLLNKNLCGIVGELKRRMPSCGMVGFNTNGTLMTRELAMRLLDEGVNWISFSLDGARKETAERIRPGLDYEQLLRNIDYVSWYRGTSKRQQLSLSANFVMMEENAEEMPAFMKLVAALGLDSVTFSHRTDFRTGLFKPLNENILIPMFQQLKELAVRHGVNLFLPSIRPQREARCYFLEIAYVRISGDVIPCCRMREGAWPGPVKVFGNVRNTSLIEIWNGSEYREFRRRVLQGDLPDECQGCEYCRGMLSY